MARPSLEELAEKGRADRAAVAARREEALRVEDSSKLGAARLSTTPLSFLTQYLVGMVTWMGVGVALTFGTIRFGWGSATYVQPGEYAPSSLSLVLTMVLIPVGLIFVEQGVARLHARTTYPPVMAWAQAVPFTLEGFGEMLAGSDDHAAKVRVSWVEPSESECAFALDAARGAGYGATVIRGNRLEIRAVVIPHDWGGVPAAAGSNYPYLRWLQALTDDLLVPLHERRALEKVEVRA